MSCALLKYLSITTIIFRLTIEIECCSMTISDIINLIHHKENYQQDPCYIQWQATQNAKLQGIWKQREQLERSSYKYNQRVRENEAMERENLQKIYLPNESKPIVKESGVWKLLGIFVGVVVAICCCAACVAALQSNDNTPTIHGPSNIPSSVSPQVPLTSVASSNRVVVNRPSITNFSTVTASPSSQQDPRGNVLLIPKRQNSLPSYDDAVKMATAPPL